MVLLLAFLSKLAALALLAVIGTGLYSVLESLKGVRRSLERITMGVRAIEQQTAPLGTRAETLIASLDGVADGVEAVNRQLAAVNHDLNAAVSALRPRA